MNVNNFIPISPEEIKNKNYDSIDVVLITPDAYVDHPSFAMAILARVMENEGFKVAILSQPDWKDVNEFKKFGKPNICFAISGGNMDSMINKYTHNRKIRSEDDFSLNGENNKRPDRATIVYSNMAKMAYKDVPIIIGGIESTMRKFVHYDYWSDTIKKPILLDSKADLLVYGMGEKPLIEILKRLKNKEQISTIRNLRGTCYKLGKSEKDKIIEDSISLPSYEEIKQDKNKFSLMTKITYENLNPFSAKTLIQKIDDITLVVNKPSLPLTTEEMDKIYDLPFTRKPHPSYKGKIPAYETIKNSIIIHRGCFGGCAFCSLGSHQGKFIQSRSINSIRKEAERLAQENKNIVITDLSAPSSNMYMMKGKNFNICKNCNRKSCLYPNICENLDYSHNQIIELLKEIKQIKGIKKVFIASGIRVDLALKSKSYIKEIVEKHTGGYLKVAPEHTEKDILNMMFKPDIETFTLFEKEFKFFSKNKEFYLIPYFISSYPGTTLYKAIDMAVFLKKHNLRPLQINDFLPTPGEWATSIYYTETDPITLEKIYVPKKESERKMHRTLLQYFKKENKIDLIKILKLAKKTNLLNFFLT